MARRRSLRSGACALAGTAISVILVSACTLPPRCSATLTTGHGDASAFIKGLSAGQTGCLVGGTYTIGTIDLHNARVTITAAAVPNNPGRRQRVILVGALSPRADNITLDNFEITGATIDAANIEIGQANNLTLSHLNIHNNGLDKQGILTERDASITNLRILDNKIHDNGTTVFDHGFYCSGPVNGALIQGNWWYNNSGFNAMQLNGVCLGFNYTDNVAFHSSTDRGIALDSGTGGANIHNSVLLGMGQTFYCGTIGSGNQVSNVVASPFSENCTSRVSFKNIFTDTPTFANQAANDYRIPNTGSAANNVARYLLGPYADQVPGPQL